MRKLPGRRPTPRINLSVQQRVTLAFAIMCLLLLGASITGTWFTQAVERNVIAARTGVDQVVSLNDLQVTWLSVTSLIDNMLLTRQTGLIEAQLDAHLQSFNTQLASLQEQPPGSSPAIQAENKTIAANLVALGASLNEATTSLIGLAKEGRWARAQALRHTELASLQRRLNASIQQLDANNRQDVAASLASATRLQNAARHYWWLSAAITILAAFILSGAILRSISRPLRQLIARVERINQRDFTPLEPMDQADEIGDLSRAFALMTAWLAESYAGFEQRVAERTHDLERRTLQVQVAAQVARDIILTANLEELLNKAVTLVHERFGFYYAGLFLLDEGGRYAILRAATGPAGRHMVAHGHRLRVGQTGLVGYATGSGEPRVSLNVNEDELHFRNPLLPDTRSELALPLKVGQRVIGALDVQSREPNAFGPDDILILQVLADQLAVAIENARLMQAVQASLAELETYQNQYGRQVWKQISQTRQVSGYQYDGSRITPLTDRRLSSSQGPAPAAQKPPVSVPLRVRGAQIGALEVWPERGELTRAEIDILTALSSRISQALESARLFDEARARAAREQAINQMTANISRSLDIDALLQTALSELGQIPGVADLSVHLNALDETDDDRVAAGASPAAVGRSPKGENP